MASLIVPKPERMMRCPAWNNKPAAAQARDPKGPDTLALRREDGDHLGIRFCPWGNESFLEEPGVTRRLFEIFYPASFRPNGQRGRPERPRRGRRGRC